MSFSWSTGYHDIDIISITGGFGFRHWSLHDTFGMF